MTFFWMLCLATAHGLQPSRSTSRRSCLAATSNEAASLMVGRKSVRIKVCLCLCGRKRVFVLARRAPWVRPARHTFPINTALESGLLPRAIAAAPWRLSRSRKKLGARAFADREREIERNLSASDKEDPPACASQFAGKTLRVALTPSWGVLLPCSFCCPTIMCIGCLRRRSAPR